MTRNWNRERWRRLYLNESLHKASWALLARALEPYLVKRALDSGWLARSAVDLLEALRPRDEERDLAEAALNTLFDDGFLLETPDGVYVANLPEAQGDSVPEPPPSQVTAPAPPTPPRSRKGRWANTTPEERSEQARRAAKARWGRTDDAPSTHAPTHGDALVDASGDACPDASGDASRGRAVSGQVFVTEELSQPDQPTSRRSQTHARVASAAAAGDALTHDASPRGGLHRSLRAALLLPVQERAKRLLDERHLAEWYRPQDWPELQRFALHFGTAMGWTPPRFPSASKTVMNLVELLATFTPEELDLAVAAAPSDSWFNSDRKGYGSLTVESVGRLLNPDHGPRKAANARGTTRQPNQGLTGWEDEEEDVGAHAR